MYCGKCLAVQLCRHCDCFANQCQFDSICNVDKSIETLRLSRIGLCQAFHFCAAIFPAREWPPVVCTDALKRQPELQSHSLCSLGDAQCFDDILKTVRPISNARCNVRLQVDQKLYQFLQLFAADVPLLLPPLQGAPFNNRYSAERCISSCVRFTVAEKC